MQKNHSWYPSTCICKNGKYLECIADISVIVYDEIINIIDSVSRNMKNIILTNIRSTVPKKIKI